MFLDGREHSAQLLYGSFRTQSGTFDKVVEEIGDGAVLMLESGCNMLRFRATTLSYWLLPGLLTSLGQYMWNLKEGKKVWVNAVN